MSSIFISVGETPASIGGPSLSAFAEAESIESEENVSTEDDICLCCCYESSRCDWHTIS